MKQQTTQMRRSYLVQRLNPAHGDGQMGRLVESLSFGGGYANGGLSQDAMSLLRPIFSFDYMGSAEFEFGAVPKALNVIAKEAHKRRLVAFSFTIATRDVKRAWSDKSTDEPEGESTVYVLCPKADRAEVESRIRLMASEPYGGYKESPMLSDVLRPGTYEPRCRGWLELDNGFFFFTDEGMWSATAAIFDVKAEVQR